MARHTVEVVKTAHHAHHHAAHVAHGAGFVAKPKIVRHDYGRVAFVGAGPPGTHPKIRADAIAAPLGSERLHGVASRLATEDRQRLGFVVRRSEQVARLYAGKLLQHAFQWQRERQSFRSAMPGQQAGNSGLARTFGPAQPDNAPKKHGLSPLALYRKRFQSTAYREGEDGMREDRRAGVPVKRIAPYSYLPPTHYAALFR